MVRCNTVHKSSSAVEKKVAYFSAYAVSSDKKKGYFFQELSFLSAWFSYINRKRPDWINTVILWKIDNARGGTIWRQPCFSRKGHHFDNFGLVDSYIEGNRKVNLFCK